MVPVCGCCREEFDAILYPPPSHILYMASSPCIVLPLPTSSASSPCWSRGEKKSVREGQTGGGGGLEEKEMRWGLGEERRQIGRAHV